MQSHQRITGREILHEAMMEWQCAGEHPQLIRQIFEQQAGQGYYDDAAATGLLSRRPDEMQWYVVELARIRAENGDLSGARAMMKRFAGPSLSAQIAEAIALALVSKGDLQGALEFAATTGVNREETLSAYAERQMANGDFAGALETAALMKSADQVFYELGVNLAMQSAQNKVHALASGMKDRKLAAKFEKDVQVTLRPPADAEVKRASPCEIACFYADRGKFAEANALVEQNKCTNNSFIATKEYALDPAGAERLLRETSDRDDLIFGLGQLAVAAAKKGNISEALRFFGDLQNLKESTAKGDLVAQDRVNDAVHGVARFWTVKDGANAVLKWARSRPTCEQRALALLGVAEAFGHANLAN
jgi:tetratricopeptide (TPR) repeat protein